MESRYNPANQAVSVQGGVPGAQDQQWRCVYDLGINTEDQGLAQIKEGERRSYVLGLGFSSYYTTFIPQYWVLTNQLKGIKKAEKFMCKESLHQGWDTSIPGIGGWRSIHLNHGLEQGNHRRDVIPSTGGAGEIHWMLGKEV